SSPPLLPQRRRQRPRPHCRLVAMRPAHGLRQAVRVLHHLFRAPPPRHPDHSALCWKIWVPLLASSSTTTSPVSPSRPRLLRLLQQQQALASSTSPSSAPATAMEAFSAGPPGDGVCLCILPCTSGIGNTGACPSSPAHSRAWQTWAYVAQWPDCIDLGIAPSTT